MKLTLYHHPFSSYCQKVLVALYESGAAFTPHLVDLSDAQARADLQAMWPIGQFPLLRAGDRVVAESSIIIEYLAQQHPGATSLIPSDADAALDARHWDRFYDQHVHTPMQKLVGDRLRPAGRTDPHGVAEARARLATAYAMIDRAMADRRWAAGDAFTIADCAAAPALYYARLVAPFGEDQANLSAYFDRLLKRPSFARVVAEAEPYRHLFPQ